MEVLMERLEIFNKMSRNRKNSFVENQCKNCDHLKWDEEHSCYRCGTYLVFWFLWYGGLECPEILICEDVLAFECFEEERTKPLSKPGGGEKSDRTHKLFGQSRMKDNRVKFWDGKFD